MSTIAICSMLHEPAVMNSANRRFRGEPVLNWTMRRMALTTRIDRVIVLAWDDQLTALGDIAVNARACGPRRPTTLMLSTAAAQRWADGWRGGLLQSCWFDKGFSADMVRQAMADEQAESVVLIDPAAGLVDPAIIDALVEKADGGTKEFYFTQAAPGLGGVLLKKALLDKLSGSHVMPGKLVHYLPDTPMLDPITSEACVDVPLAVSRVADRFTLDSERQVARLEQATLPLNGTLISSRAEAVVKRAATTPRSERLPRDITLELTTRRITRPTFAAVSHAQIRRPDLSQAHVDAIVDSLQGMDDVRITLAGVGDPLLHATAIRFIRQLSAVASIAVETDLLCIDRQLLTDLVTSGVDVVAVHLPATTARTYAKVMGIDAMPQVLENVRRLLEERQRMASGTPVVVPMFTKLMDNFEEMEPWFDTWLRAIGSATITGPSTFGGRVASVGVADMTPPNRRPCLQIKNRMTILSDGAIVACEQDPLGENPLGTLGANRLEDVWQGSAADLRARHERLIELPQLCNRCTEWHRP